MVVCTAEVYNPVATSSHLLQSSYNNVTLWGHPAWISVDDTSIKVTAAAAWVRHNRIRMATDRTTVAEVIGSVKGVIPNSKLASYGDFRYNFDIEAIYDEINSQIPDLLSMKYKEALRYDSTKLEQEDKHGISKVEGILLGDYPSFLRIRDLVKEMTFENMRKIPDRPHSIAIDAWLSHWKSFLKSVSRAVGENDPWLDSLLKTCCRFLALARDDQFYLLLLETDMPFINNYSNHLTDSVTITELLSIPQPLLEDDSKLTLEQIDDLWLNLSSRKVRKLWPKTAVAEEIRNSFSEFPNVEVGSTNFLRRSASKVKGKNCNNVEVPEEDARHLLGLLLEIMDRSSEEVEISMKKVNITNFYSSSSDRPEKLSPSSTKNLHKDLWPNPAQPENILASLSNLQVSPLIPNLQITTPNLFVPPKHLADRSSYANLALPQPKLRVPSPYVLFPPGDMTGHPKSALKLPNLAVPPPNLFVPPPNFRVLPKSMESYSAVLKRPNLLAVSSCNSTFPFENAGFHHFYSRTLNQTLSNPTASRQSSTNCTVSLQVPEVFPQVPVHFQLPIVPLVKREGKYYNKYRRNLTKINLTDLSKTPKQQAISTGVPFNTRSLEFGKKNIENTNQLSSSQKTHEGTRHPNRSPIDDTENLQQGVPIKMIPQKLEKNNPLQVEYILKELDRHRILQNISNKSRITKSQVEVITNYVSSLNSQNSKCLAQSSSKLCNDSVSLDLHGSPNENIQCQKPCSFQFQNKNETKIAMKTNIKGSVREFQQSNENKKNSRKHCKTKSYNTTSNASNSPRQSKSKQISMNTPSKEIYNENQKNMMQIYEETNLIEHLSKTVTKEETSNFRNWNEDSHYERSIQNLKDVQSQLLWDEGTIIDQGSERVDGFTHLKIAILEIVKRALILLGA